MPLFTTRTPRVVAARRLHRRRDRDRERRFLAEGPQAVREALRRPALVREIFATPGTEVDAPDTLISRVDQAALKALTETETPQGVVAVCDHLDVPLAEALTPRPPLVVVLVDVRDPGNAGTVLRTADAAGATAVIFAGDSVDPYNGKTVRATAGSLFHLDVVRAADPLSLVASLRGAGLQTLATTGYADRDLDSVTSLAAPTAWLFGSEAHGLPRAVIDAADAAVRVPIHGRAESLNLAAAAAVCLYASAGAQKEPPP